jgi:DNA polymerase III alpha subunit
MPAEPAFVHLHVHSSYSLLEGALTIARLAELAKKDRQPALALTDTDNMFGAGILGKAGELRDSADRRLCHGRRFWRRRKSQHRTQLAAPCSARRR